MENSEMFTDAKEAKEGMELLEMYLELQAQIANPTRFGMIAALSNAQIVAPQEITTLEISQGDIYNMLWTSFSDCDLYRKLSQYQQGIYIHAVNKLGEEAFKKLLKEYVKGQNQK